MTGSFAAVIFREGHIQHPVEGVFDAPVLANGTIDALGVGRQAAEVLTGFALALAGGFEVALGFHAYQTTQGGPLVGLLNHDKSSITEQVRVSTRPWPTSTCDTDRQGRNRNASCTLSNRFPWLSLTAKT